MTRVRQISMAYSPLIVDNFAGGGGASTGIHAGIGRHVDIAINHDAEAIGMHEANHPGTRHYCESVWDIDPRKVTGGAPVDLAWFSPDCKHFSKAKGATPVDKRIRGLAWVALRWAATVRPAVIMLENVEEFTTWGPVIDGRPCPKRRGHTFRSFTNALNRQGYAVEYRELRACDYGVPTIRKRLFMIARCDGQPIVWPKPTHGPGRLPYRTAADIIDWSIPCPSIFDRKRPLAEATQRRIFEGLRRHVIEAGDNAFIVPVTHAGGVRVHPISEPVRTVTTAHRGELALVAPVITKFRKGNKGVSVRDPLATVTANSYITRPGGAPPIGLVTATISRQFGASVGSAMDAPIGTTTAGGGGKSALVTAWLAKHYTGVIGTDLRQPAPTVTSIDHSAVVTSHLVHLRQHMAGSDVRDPLPTVCAGGTHHGEVRAFLIKYYGAGGQTQAVDEPAHTVTSKARLGLVTIHGEDYQIVDIGMRMLSPRELYRAQGFPDDYIIDRLPDGTPLTKTAQIRMCGNSVCPPLAAALVRANLGEAADAVAA